MFQNESVLHFSVCVIVHLYYLAPVHFVFVNQGNRCTFRKYTWSMYNCTSQMRDMFVCALSSSHRTCYKCHARATSRRTNTHNLPFIESTTNTLLMTILNNVFSLFCICVVYTLGTLVRCDACRVHVVCMWHVLECEKSMSVHYIVVYESSLDSEYVRHTSECAAAAAGACE